MEIFFDDNNNNYKIKILTKHFLYNQFGGKLKWKELCHNGVMFPKEYIKHDIPIIYNGNKIILNKNAEEYATMYAKYIDSDYIKNPIFNKNFWSDWKEVINNEEISNLKDCDFSLIHEHIINLKVLKQNLSKEEKENIKQNTAKKAQKYSVAIIDGDEQDVGNFRVEPPGIFIGRGCHPKLGKIKRRIYPEDIIINIGKNCNIPEPLPGHKWGKIIHDRKVEWLASWKDDITGKVKYVWLSNQSKFKSESDIKKFELSRKLKRKIKTIRDINNKNLVDENINIRQVATALYFIDVLALRVGNEKSSSEADTVGVTSLRVEHIKLDNNKVSLDFLGKDSIRYKKIFVVDNRVYQNLEQFIQNKKSSSDLFDKINSSDINKYLQGFMKNLTAKVFRTYNASYLFQKELKKVNKKVFNMNDGDKINLLLDGYNKANIKVAVLCNHQKKVSKNFDNMINKYNDRIKLEQKKLKKTKNKDRKIKIKNNIKKIKSTRDLKIELKSISLETSKVNYIDPRITIAFMKKHDLSIDKIFSKQLQNKFQWAFNVDSNWKY